MESAATPPAPPQKGVLEKTAKRPIQSQVNRLNGGGRSRSRARAPVISSHRLRPVNSQVTTSSPPTSPLVRSNAVINNRRLRVRQRGQINTKTTPKIPSNEDTPSSVDVISTETPSIGSTRSVSRHRSRIVNQRRINPPSTERNFQSTKPLSIGGFGSRSSSASNSKTNSPSRFNTNRVRVRSRARNQNAVETASTTSGATLEQQRQIESTTETVSKRLLNSQEEDKSRGKLQDEVIFLESTTQVNTVKTTNNNIQEEGGGEDKQEDNKSTLRPALFRPRFGTRQRDTVRNKLRTQLLEGKPNPVTKAPLKPLQLNEVESITESSTATTVSSSSSTTVGAGSFKTVSPSSGLNAIPASFFTTTPRFLKDAESTTALPEYYILLLAI